MSVDRVQNGAKRTKLSPLSCAKVSNSEAYDKVVDADPRARIANCTVLMLYGIAGVHMVG
jgi:hypothetical protein